MIEIKDLFAKYDKLLFREEKRRESIIEILNKVLNIQIRPEDVTIKNNVVFLNLKPIYKNEIYLKKEQILKEIEEKIKGKPPNDIR